MRYLMLMLLIVTIHTSCGERKRLLLVDFAQQDGIGVYLNETLVFAFSEEIDPSSIRGNAVSLHTEDGEPARGLWKVLGKELRFYPHLPMKSDGSDAGLIPGREYTVSFKGFPSYGALQSVEGIRLEQSRTLRFRTVENSGFSTALFLDPEPDAAPEMISINDTPIIDVDIDGLDVVAGSVLKIAFTEPLFPVSVEESKAEICVLNVEGTVDMLPLHVTYGSDPSHLLIRPMEGFHSGECYKIMPGKLDFYDFGGKPASYRFLFLEIDCVAAQDKEDSRNTKKHGSLENSSSPVEKEKGE